MATRRNASSPDRWRPRDRRGPACGYTFDEVTCSRRGAHYCQPRADRVVAFFRELLVHVKGPYSRTAFVPEDWQDADILRPLFGEVVWSSEWRRYVRRYRVAYIVLGRKNGKSEIVSGITLYLLVGDDEEAAEVYGAAKDTKQAGKVFEPAVRMTQLSPVLRKRVSHNKNARRLIDERTASYYEVITADALGELGHNPHGFVLDEVLSQRDGSLWDAMRTAAGARTQPLLVCITTETNDPTSFGADMIDEAERIAEDPARAPHVFAFIRKTPRTDDEVRQLVRRHPGHPDLPVSTDVWDERNWRWANPALGQFLSLEALRQEALEARNDPAKENPFRQFRLNQRVSQATRYIQLDDWDACAGELAAGPEWLAPKLAGQRCYAGLDLSSKFDLSAWALLFEDGHVLWRFWVPEDTLAQLDPVLGGRLSVWAREGWLTATDGDVIDYEQIYEQIAQDARRYKILKAAYDKWSGEPVRQRIEADTRLELVESATTYERMTEPLKELKRLLLTRELAHGGNPVARWHADSLETKSPRDDPDRLRPVKPERGAHDKRIDGMAALLLAIDARVRETPAPDVAANVH